MKHSVAHGSKATSGRCGRGDEELDQVRTRFTRGYLWHKREHGEQPDGEPLSRGFSLQGGNWGRSRSLACGTAGANTPVQL